MTMCFLARSKLFLASHSQRDKSLFLLLTVDFFNIDVFDHTISISNWWLVDLILEYINLSPQPLTGFHCHFQCNVEENNIYELNLLLLSDQARKKLLKILQTELDERRAMRKSDDRQKAKKGMIDLMMEVEDENGTKLEDEDIKDLLLMFLLAGHESTSHAAMWTILYLHLHPEMLQKAKVWDCLLSQFWFEVSIIVLICKAEFNLAGRAREDYEEKTLNTQRIDPIRN